MLRRNRYEAHYNPAPPGFSNGDTIVSKQEEDAVAAALEAGKHSQSYGKLLKARAAKRQSGNKNDDNDDDDNNENINSNSNKPREEENPLAVRSCVCSFGSLTETMCAVTIYGAPDRRRVGD